MKDCIFSIENDLCVAGTKDELSVSDCHLFQNPDFQIQSRFPHTDLEIPENKRNLPYKTGFLKRNYSIAAACVKAAGYKNIRKYYPSYILPARFAPNDFPLIPPCQKKSTGLNVIPPS